ncbi:hypothetical protein B0H14DRAFT_3726964 [Mycena olivaceomarginata]|nr:hypothetical protein B0H14DRAFT_3726964 [Mycena olivaceomarginata]
MTRTARTTIADGTLTGHTIAVVFSVTFVASVAEAVPFQATVVPLPKQTPAPASADTATPNPFAGNPFVRQAAGSVNPFVKLRIAGPSSQSSSSKFDNSHFHDDPQPASNAAILPCLARWRHTSKTRGHQLQVSKNKPLLSIPRTSLSKAEAYRGWERLRMASPSYSGSSTDGVELSTDAWAPPLNERYQNTSFITPQYRFTTTVQLPGLLQALTARGLVTALEIAERSNTGQNFWPELDSAIRILLTNSGVVLSYSRHHQPPYPFEIPLGKLWDHSPLPLPTTVFSHRSGCWRDFNDHAGKLLHSTKRVRHPSQEKIRILFVAPCWGHLQGPLSLNANGRDIAHPCFPLRVFEKTDLMDFDEDEPTSECLEECPGGARITELSDSEFFPLPSSSAFFPLFGPSLKREAPPTDSDSAPKRQKGPTIIIVDDDDAPTGGKPTAAYSDIEMDIIDSSEDEPQSANLVQQLMKAVRAIAGAWQYSLGL